MSKQLYEEALADVKKIKEVAEANAQRAVLDVVVPRIRDLIENELLREHNVDDDEFAKPGSVAPDNDDLITDLVSPATRSEEIGDSAIAPPDAEGKVTLDIDAMCADPAGVSIDAPMMGAFNNDEYEINLESLAALSPVLNATKNGAAKEFELRVYRLGEMINKFKGAGALIQESNGYQVKIAQMISRVEDMYDYLQGSIVDSAKKNLYETKLESYFKELNKLQGLTMSKKHNKKTMNEADVTLKLTGLPDDVDLDSVGVDLITGEEDDLDVDSSDDVDSEESDEDTDDEFGSDMDLGDLDMGGSEQGEEDMGENLRLSDDTIVEIDENMLRREIFRIKKLREEAVPSTAGHAPSGKELDDFGGGSDEGSPFDVDMPDLSPAKAARPLGEADDEDMDEADQMDESDAEEMDEADMDEVGNRRSGQDFGTDVSNGHETPKQNMPYAESVSRRLSFEKKLQERAKSRAKSIKLEASKSKSKLKVEALKKEYAQVSKRFNESLARANKLNRLVAESAKKSNRSNQNGGSSRSAATENALRNKLAETNLINAKLMFTNKLLQNESLTSRAKAQVIEQLDSATTVREAKLVYESLNKALGGTSKSVNENRDRKVLGSSSRTTRPASTQAINEGYEADRWARLAGINKQ
jgi:hypothetical protein